MTRNEWWHRLIGSILPIKCISLFTKAKKWKISSQRRTILMCAYYMIREMQRISWLHLNATSSSVQYYPSISPKIWFQRNASLEVAKGRGFAMESQQCMENLAYSPDIEITCKGSKKYEILCFYRRLRHDVGHFVRRYYSHKDMRRKADMHHEMREDR